ncbi:MAG: phage baseplate assembly protein V [Actinomycetia bacterium]|nr:phage baseplate assembly protein V [Actinomycetes bacterium]
MSATTTELNAPKVSRSSPKVTVNGNELSVDEYKALLTARVDRGLGLPGRVTLRFRDVGHKMAKSSKFKLGAKIIVKIESTSLITAYVTGVSAVRPRRENPEYVVTADDMAYRLTRGIKPSVYLNMTPSDVVNQLASAAGLSASVSSSAKFGTALDYQFQTGTAMAYLNALCRRAGAVWWVDDTTLNVKASTENSGSATRNVNNDFLEFSLRASGLYPTEVEVAGWDPVQKQPVTGTASSANDRGSAPALVSDYLGSTSSLSAAKSSFGDYNPLTNDEATSIAAALLDDAAHGSVVARGTCYADPDLAPGVKLTLSNSDVYNGDYFITEVAHVYSASGFHTNIVAGPHRVIGLVDQLANPEADPGLARDGLIVGKVTKNSDDPANLGRVQVQYLAQPGSLVSSWARVAAPGAGNNRGTMFHPVVNDEVIIGFENSDIDRPIVLGCVWGGSDNLPTASTLPDDSGKVAARQVASVAGHIIEFGEDTSDTSKEHIKFVVASGQTLRLGADKVTLDTGGKPFELTAGSGTIKIDDQGNITISGAKVSIEGQQQLDLKAPQLSGKADQTLSLEGSAQATLKGAQAEVNGSATLAIKGGMVQIN